MMEQMRHIEDGVKSFLRDTSRNPDSRDIDGTTKFQLLSEGFESVCDSTQQGILDLGREDWDGDINRRKARVGDLKDGSHRQVEITPWRFMIIAHVFLVTYFSKISLTGFEPYWAYGLKYVKPQLGFLTELIADGSTGVKEAYRPLPHNGLIARKREEYPYILKLDIRKFFDSILRGPLMDQLSRVITDERDLRIAERLVTRKAPVGLQQGEPVSAILADFSLLPLDQGLREAGFTTVRFADDFALVGNSEEEINEGHQCATELLRNLGLDLHPTDCILAPSDPVLFCGQLIRADHITLTEDRLCELGRNLRRVQRGSEVVREEARAQAISTLNELRHGKSRPVAEAGIRALRDWNRNYDYNSVINALAA